jgi:signal transduction histidine kinase
LICQNEREEKKKIFEAHANKTEHISINKTCQHKNGTEAIIESHIVPRINSEGKLVGFRGVDRDITERKKVEQEIENSRKYLEIIFSSMLSGIVIIDQKTHQIVDANPAALQMMNTSREVAIGKVCHSFFCPAEIGKCPITDLGLTVDKSEKILLSNNRKQTNILKSVGRIEHNGRSLLIENFVDISERKQMEERLLKSERLAAIGELATMVAHDLRNPLQGIAASIHFVKKATEQNRTEKMSIVLQRIQDSIRYSEKIIRDLLDYSANLKIEYDESNPHLLVQQSLCGIVIPARIEVVDLTQENPKLHVDIEGIKRVIVNLVTNAIEAMPEGGTLTIACKENQDKVQLSFADTGTGIPLEKINKLWTPFVTTKAKGMGLGLPICKRIVEGHKGEINVETENGKGTTFTITIPKKAPEKENFEFIVKEPSVIFLEKR